MIAIAICIIFFLLLVNYRRNKKIITRSNTTTKIPLNDEEKSFDNNFQVKSVTSWEAVQVSNRMKNNPKVVYREIMVPKHLDGAIDKDRAWEQLYEIEIKECILRIEENLKDSRYNPSQNKYMIPLCISFSDKEYVKALGAVWCGKTKSWFFDFSRDKYSVEKWLPQIYKSTNIIPYIQPRLVPEKLWYLNLRSLLTKEQWDLLKKKTYEQSGYRCSICGCKGEKWPVECDEEWDYEINYQTNIGMVHFKGLRSLCSRCHQVRHFGKAKVEGNNNMALARLMVLNKWCINEAQKAVDLAFKEWEKMSTIDQWLFNSDILEEKYGIFLQKNDFLTPMVY